MKKKTNKPLNDDDIALFRNTVGEVKPVQHRNAEIAKKTPAPIPKQLEKDNQAVIQDMLSDHYDPTELDTSEEISFHRPGIQHSVLRKLRRGQYSVRAELDLHGMTIVEARPALIQFLNEARAAHYQCVRVIHGKGRRSSNKGPVLKPMVNKWLTQLSEILAFCTARPIDGGSGAVYVLLKKV